jgi:dTDP-4-dehydrorhamnose reductase
MPTVLITGSNGLLGQKLVALLSGKTEYTVVATSRGVNRLPETGAYTYHSLDVTNREEVRRLIGQVRPAYIIHTAAMTNVDQCESEREACWQLNVASVEFLAEAAAIYDCFLLQLSTDFIFDGENGPYTEEAEPRPLSYYGESKRAAEEILRNSRIRWAIARTVLVYGIAHDMSRSNLVLWVKKSLENRQPIKVVDDQWRTPTLAEDLATGCYLIIKHQATGIFHISGKDLLTPYQMALQAAGYFGLDASYIERVDSATFTQPARRPLRTGFSVEKARRQLGYEPRSFAEGLEILAKQIR